ncbi:MAG: glutathione S-transferase family protein [Kordiimonadaceae bacterium]|nr:glutathione S-transferase family protein [Kordiimonadaceae bacterium]
MSEFTLIIGNKNNSTWSLRGYLALKHAGVDFEEILVSLRPILDREKLDRLTPAGKVPTLLHGDHYIWDSLAIGEYLNDLYPEKLFWPDDINIRAHARCVSAEMHSGFAALRSSMPMACLSIFEKPQIEGELKKDIDRITQIWSECRNKYAAQGPYLFGTYSIADMMFSPIGFRFLSYQIELPEILKNYSKVMVDHPGVKAWLDGADPNDAAEPDARI